MLVVFLSDLMDTIRGIVSKNKKRYKEDGFNLDLSYVCDNVIAMGFPADRLEGVYRNNIDVVVKFFEKYHKGHYKIYNLCSNRSYNYQKFHGRVAVYPFEDHHPPDLKLMRPFCEDVYEWLKKDSENVVAVHCKAGKGRTGVMICAYLLYIGMFARPKEALEYYGQRRTMDMNGVTIPSQIRYVEYFGYLLNTNASYRTVPMFLKSIHFETIPHCEKLGTHCNPFFAVYSGGKKVYKSQVYEPSKKAGCAGDLTMPVTETIVIEDDVRIDFYHRPPNWLQREKMFHFWFNTFFVCHCPYTGGLPVVRETLSPRKSGPVCGMRRKVRGNSVPTATLTTELIMAARQQTSAANGHVVNSSSESSYTSDTSWASRSNSIIPGRRCRSRGGEDLSTTSWWTTVEKKITPPCGGVGLAGVGTQRSLSSPTPDPEDYGLGERHVLTLTKFELDRACKDKSDKIFSQDFKVHVLLECLPVVKDTQTDDLYENRPPNVRTLDFQAPLSVSSPPHSHTRKNTLRACASADQPINASHPSAHPRAASTSGSTLTNDSVSSVDSGTSVPNTSGFFLAPPDARPPGAKSASASSSRRTGGLKVGFSIEEGSSNVHWSSDSEDELLEPDKDEESDVLPESLAWNSAVLVNDLAGNLDKAVRFSDSSSSRAASQSVSSDCSSGLTPSDSSASSGVGVKKELQKGSFAQTSLPQKNQNSGSKFPWPGKRRGSVPS